MEHTVTEIQRFCMHDGPGLRTTVFLKGCPLNCFWCHNPETKNAAPQLLYHSARCIGCGACLACPRGVHGDSGGRHRVDFAKCIGCGRCADLCPTKALTVAGTRMDSRQIVEAALRDRAFYGQTGGLTLSGGEPMFRPEACLELLGMAKAAGLHTALETCGYFDGAYMERLCRVTDCFLWDIKDTDDARHRANTGVSNGRILQNLRLADRYGVPIVLRCVLLEGVNREQAHIDRVKALFASLRSGVRIDWLPCHCLGSAKAEALGLPQRDLRQYEPPESEMAKLK